MDDLQKQLADEKSKLSVQNHRIQVLQDRNALMAQPSLAKPTPGPSGKIWPSKGQSKTSHSRYLGDTIAFKNKRHNTVSYGRSTKQPEDFEAGMMRPLSPNKGNLAAMIAALEKEGFGAGEVASEEAALYLWKMKGQAEEQLKKERNVSS